ncbi:MAG: cytochrome d ubiquinol oxidase subunit II [Steroidobacteraceae bacterium]
MAATSLSIFWAGVIAFSILMYVILDGFDLGVGILFGTTPAEENRQAMLNTIAPFWDGNETWLVVIGASLFGAFPTVYAVFLGAFYVPVLLLLVGLIFRGIAFEFRGRAKQMLWLWDLGFWLGSVVVAFVQGAAVGAMLKGIPVLDGQFAGHAFDWARPFPILTGIGMVFGYALLGACWLVVKSEGAIREWAFARITWLVVAVFIVLGLAFTVSLTVDQGAIAQSNLRERSWGLIFPLLGFAALLGTLIASRRQRRDRVPFALSMVFFFASYLTLGVMLWPYMIPYSVTVANAAAPDVSLGFLFYGAIVVLPVIAAYTIGVYWVFRGKTQRGDGRYS